MKTSLKTLLALAAFGASALFVSAQPAPKIAVLDMAKVFDGHYKTQDQQVKLKADEEKVNEEISKIVKEGQGLAEKYKELVEQTKNPVLTADARKAAEADAARQLEEVRKKEQQFGEYRNEVNRNMQQRIGSFRQMKFPRLPATSPRKKGLLYSLRNPQRCTPILPTTSPKK